MIKKKYYILTFAILWFLLSFVVVMLMSKNININNSLFNLLLYGSVYVYSAGLINIIYLLFQYFTKKPKDHKPTN